MGLVFSNCAKIFTLRIFNFFRVSNPPDLQEEEIGRHDGSHAEYFSERIQEMIDQQGQFSSEVDFRIAASEENWTEVLEPDGTGIQDLSEETFSTLQENWGDKLLLKITRDRVTLGRKIGEGTQAEIYEGRIGDQSIGECAVKVFKTNSLSALQTTWPDRVFDLDYKYRICSMYGGVLLDKNRYAFVMLRFQGDLRSTIDTMMMRNNMCGPPFGDWKDSLWMMGEIAYSMEYLHSKGVLHRDLKADNILISAVDDPKYFVPWIADYECSARVVGTGFWRAPEVLQALQNRKTIYEVPKLTTKTDVYSYGMTCYEILTGKVPFEGHPVSHFDPVLKGERPKLPTDVHPRVHELVSKCWDAEPDERPNFSEIVDEICAIDPEFKTVLKR